MSSSPHLHLASDKTLRLEHVIIANFQSVAPTADFEDVQVADDHDAFGVRTGRWVSCVDDLALLFDQIVVADDDRSGFGNNARFGMNHSASADRDVPLQLALRANHGVG